MDLEREEEKKGEKHDAICDVCDFQIIGTRYKCINCKDYDMCQYCEEAIFENNSHCWQHVFLKLPKPFSNEILRKQYYENLWTGKYDNNPTDVPKRDPNLIHKIYCKKCSHPIIGGRFCCTSCEDYNLCEACEISSNHPHFFLKIRYALPNANSAGKIRINLEEEGSKLMLVSSGTSIRKPKITETEKKGNVTVNIRTIQLGDIDHVWAIETESFFTPYSRSFFTDFPDTDGCFLFVAEKSDKVIGGYIAFKISKGRVQLVSIAVGSNSRRMGIAQQMITTMMRMCHEMSISEAYLHVSVMNFPAQNLYQSFGFVPSKWIQNYYVDESEDAIIMVNDNISGYFDPSLKKSGSVSQQQQHNTLTSSCIIS